MNDDIMHITIIITIVCIYIFANLLVLGISTSCRVFFQFNY